MFCVCVGGLGWGGGGSPNVELNPKPELGNFRQV